MSFATLPIRLTPFSLFKVLLHQHYKRKPWLVLVYALVFAAYYVLSTDLVSGLFWLRAVGSGLLLALLLYPPIQYWRTVNLPENRTFYLPRVYTFTPETIETHIRNEKRSESAWEVTDRVEEYKEHYLLFLTQTQFFFIPKRSFQSDADHFAFRKLLWEWQLVDKEPVAA